jgi:integrating conjugative element protein (TIGR03759 family)
LDKKSKKIIITFLLSSIAITNARASIFGWHLNSKGKNDPNSEYHKRLPLAFTDDITSDQNPAKIKLTPAQKHEALVWGLSEQQEKRYVLLVRNKSGWYFKNTTLTPVEILGINAKTDEERAQYAVLDAKQEFAKNAKILAFNAAYSKAAFALKDKLNLPVIRKFDYSKYSPYNYKPIQLQKNDKLMLFIKKNENVKPIVSYLMAEIERNAAISLNVYFIDSKISKKDIVNWAKGQNIPSDMVNHKLITLNFDFDHGQYAKIKAKNKKTPLMLLVRNGKSRIVDTGRF